VHLEQSVSSDRVKALAVFCLRRTLGWVNACDGGVVAEVRQRKVTDVDN
jgi:hypothetical protein